MSFEADFIALLNPLVGGKVFFDSTPDGFLPNVDRIIVQQVGGKEAWYVDQSLPSHKHARMQVFVWTTDRLTASPLARLVAKTIAESAFVAEPYGAPASEHQPVLKLFGSRQDFGIWYPDP
jgi:hypothetical protein